MCIRDRDYLGLKGVVEKLLETARVADARFARNTAGTSYHPGRCADIWLGEDKLGTIGEVHPVSYTHLDVYKRQPQDPCLPSAPNVRRRQRRTGDGELGG